MLLDLIKYAAQTVAVAVIPGYIWLRFRQLAILKGEIANEYELKAILNKLDSMDPKLADLEAKALHLVELMETLMTRMDELEQLMAQLAQPCQCLSHEHALES